MRQLSKFDHATLGAIVLVSFVSFFSIFLDIYESASEAIAFRFCFCEKRARFKETQDYTENVYTITLAHFLQNESHLNSVEKFWLRRQNFVVLLVSDYY